MNKKEALILSLGMVSAVILGSVVIFSLLPPAVQLTRRDLIFGAPEADKGKVTRPQPIPVSPANPVLGTRSRVFWRAHADKKWIDVRPAAGRGQGILEIDVDRSPLSAGTHRGKVSVRSAGLFPSSRDIAVTLYVYKGEEGRVPFGTFEKPDGPVSFQDGAIHLAGWALDDVEVVTVEIKRIPLAGDSPQAVGPDGLVPVGRADLVEKARPDVAKAFPEYPLNHRAGWGFLPGVYRPRHRERTVLYGIRTFLLNIIKSIL